MMIVCSDDRMSVPPDRSIATAMRVVIRPHTPVTHGVGLTRPRWLIVPITVDAESAVVMKNVASSTIVNTDTMPGHGSSSIKANSMASAVPSPQIDRPVRSNSMAVPPKMENHTSVSTDGTTTMPTTNSRMVRPREMRARNMPTNGVHDTHHTQ